MSPMLPRLTLSSEGERYPKKSVENSAKPSRATTATKP